MNKNGYGEGSQASGGLGVKAPKLMSVAKVVTENEWLLHSMMSVAENEWLLQSMMSVAENEWVFTVLVKECD